jgi:[acyl-carrier-protein] S-malonyltransferase
MGEDVYQADAEGRVFFEKAAEALPGVLDVMFKGPAEKLAQTHIAQVALLTVEIALNRRLRSRQILPAVCAGHSLGEFSALACAGSLKFEEALRLVKLRGRCMAENAPEGGMAAVVGITADEVSAALPEGVVIANYNGPLQTIVSGTLEGLAEAEPILKEAGAKRVIPLAVSGPFHSPLMEPAARAFEDALRSADIADPQCRFVSSVSGEPATTAEEIRQLLIAQICSPVRWTQVMQTIGPVKALEIGPGRVLQGLAKRMENAPKISAVGTLADADAVEA